MQNQACGLKENRPPEPQNPAKEGAAGNASGAGAFPVKNTFIHYGTPVRTSTRALASPQTVPPNFAPEGLIAREGGLASEWPPGGLGPGSHFFGSYGGGSSCGGGLQQLLQQPVPYPFGGPHSAVVGGGPPPLPGLVAPSIWPSASASGSRPAAAAAATAATFAAFTGPGVVGGDAGPTKRGIAPLRLFDFLPPAAPGGNGQPLPVCGAHPGGTITVPAGASLGNAGVSPCAASQVPLWSPMDAALPPMPSIPGAAAVAGPYAAPPPFPGTATDGLQAVGWSPWGGGTVGAVMPAPPQQQQQQQQLLPQQLLVKP
jgi:hypothetical protein